jgi:PEP-CTERM motif
VVPEASTWAMMLLGFVGVGFVGYRQSRNGREDLSAA